MWRGSVDIVGSVIEMKDWETETVEKKKTEEIMGWKIILVGGGGYDTLPKIGGLE